MSRAGLPFLLADGAFLWLLSEHQSTHIKSAALRAGVRRAGWLGAGGSGWESHRCGPAWRPERGTAAHDSSTQHTGQHRAGRRNASGGSGAMSVSAPPPQRKPSGGWRFLQLCAPAHCPPPRRRNRPASRKGWTCRATVVLATLLAPPPLQRSGLALVDGFTERTRCCDRAAEPPRVDLVDLVSSERRVYMRSTSRRRWPRPMCEICQHSAASATTTQLREQSQQSTCTDRPRPLDLNGAASIPIGNSVLTSCHGTSSMIVPSR